MSRATLLSLSLSLARCEANEAQGGLDSAEADARDMHRDVSESSVLKRNSRARVTL